MFTNYQKILFSILILLGMLFYPLYVAQAVSGWLIVIKEYVLDLIARVIARILGNILSNSIIKNVNESGRPTASGGKTPAFVQDWRQFLQTAQRRGDDIAKATLADAILGSNPTICPHLRAPLQTALRAGTTVRNFDYTKYLTDASQYFKTRNQCTLPTNFNLTTFKNNFAGGGGWSSWQKLIQPQNNIFGTYADSLKELNIQRGFEKKIDTSEAESGGGFTSKRSECVSGGTADSRPRCVILGKAITPGKLFGDTGANALKFELEFIGVSDEIAEVVVNVIGTLVNRLADYTAKELLDTAGPSIGADEAAAPGGNFDNAPGQAREDCVSACIASNCPPPLDACEYVTDPVTNVTTATNSPCTPDDPDPRDACVNNCQTQRCTQPRFPSEVQLFRVE